MDSCSVVRQNGCGQGKIFLHSNAKNCFLLVSCIAAIAVSVFYGQGKAVTASSYAQNGFIASVLLMSGFFLCRLFRGQKPVRTQQQIEDIINSMSKARSKAKQNEVLGQLRQFLSIHPEAYFQNPSIIGDLLVHDLLEPSQIVSHLYSYALSQPSPRLVRYVQIAVEALPFEARKRFDLTRFKMAGSQAITLDKAFSDWIILFNPANLENRHQLIEKSSVNEEQAILLRRKGAISKAENDQTLTCPRCVLPGLFLCSAPGEVGTTYDGKFVEVKTSGLTDLLRMRQDLDCFYLFADQAEKALLTGNFYVSNEALFPFTDRISVRREASDGAGNDEAIAKAIAEESNAADKWLTADRKLTEKGNKASKHEAASLCMLIGYLIIKKRLHLQDALSVVMDGRRDVLFEPKIRQILSVLQEVELGRANLEEVHKALMAKSNRCAK